MSATSLDLSQIKTDALSAASSFRTLIGLGTLATQSGTFSGTSSGTNTGDQDLSGLLVKASNLSDLTNAATARTNLGLGSGNTPTFLGALLTGGTVTASTPLVDATQTWNSAGTVFTGMRLNVTDTASSSSSLLMDLQVGGVSQVSVNKSGVLTLPLGSGANPSLKIGSAQTGFHAATNSLHAVVNGASRLRIDGNGVARATGAFNVPTTQYYTFDGQVYLYSDATNVLAQRHGDTPTNAQTFRIYNTFTDSSNYERGKLEWSSNVLRIGTEKAGTGSARALELQTDGVTRLTIGTTGTTTFSGSVNVGGQIRLQSASNTRLAQGGNDGDLQIFRNDASTPGQLLVGEITASGNLTISTKNIVTDTTTGTKIGTATTQKLGFYNATPVVQPTAVADATDAASVITQLNALLSRMRDLGLIAT